jgi:acyl-CoA thioester hydrolase
MDHTQFKHVTPIQVRFVDIDAFGHVNNAVFASYYEMARVAYFDQVLGERVNWNQTGMILAKNILEYRFPIFLRDKIKCYSAVTKLGNKSFEIHNTLVRVDKAEETLVAFGIGTLVCYNYELKETIEIPETWRKCLMEFEGLK